VRVAAFRSQCLSLAKYFSIGLRSGEYLGRKKSLAPAGLAMPATTAVPQSRLRCRQVRFLKVFGMAGQSPERPASEWMTYSAAAERLGVSPSSIALRAGRWPMRKRSDTGEVEIEVPGSLLAVHTVRGSWG